MITFKNKYDGSLVMSQQTHAQEVTSHFPVARLVTIGHFQSEQSLVVVAQWEEHALSVSPNSQTKGITFQFVFVILAHIIFLRMADLVVEKCQYSTF